MFTVYTVGHSTYPNERFIQLLNNNEINCVIDVRSIPYSKYAGNFNKDKIQPYLKNNRILYIFMGKELGARPEDTNLYAPEGYLDFEKVSQNGLFQSGIARVLSGLQKGYRIALMCTEKDPIDCHRAILVGRELEKRDCSVLHIEEDGKFETQGQLEQRMLNHYFPNWGQQAMFVEHDTNVTRDELILKSYHLKNEEIGYRLETGYKEVVHEDFYDRVY